MGRGCTSSSGKNALGGRHHGAHAWCTHPWGVTGLSVQLLGPEEIARNPQEPKSEAIKGVSSFLAQPYKLGTPEHYPRPSSLCTALWEENFLFTNDFQVSWVLTSP